MTRGEAAAMWRARDTAAKMLGRLGAFIVEPLPDIVYTDIMETPLQMFLSKVLVPRLNTGSAYHRVGVSLLILVSLGVNITVILSYLRCPRLHTPNNIHVVSLAGADTLVAAISMPITAIKMSRNER